MSRIRKSSDSLFRLVKSLSMNEKGYFKKYIQTQEGKKSFQYIRLFDIINKQEIYDEEKIRQLFKDVAAKDLSSLKAYLYNALLKSLSYQEGDFTNIRIRKLLLEAEVLINRSLFDEGRILLVRAMDIAEKNEYFPEILEIYYGFFRLASEPDIGSLQKNFQKQNDVLDKHRNLIAYRTLSNKSYLISHKGKALLNKSTRTGFTEILNDPLLSNVSACLSFRAKTYFYLIPAVIYHNYLSDHKKALDYYKSLVKLMETNDVMRTEIAHTYIDAVNGLLQCLLFLNKLSEYNSSKSLWKLVTNVSRLVEHRVFEKKLLNETIYYLKSGKIRTGLEFLEKEEKNLQNYFAFNPDENVEAEESIIEPARFQILLNIVILNFYCREYKNAMRYINKINLNLTGIKNYHIQALAQIIHLLIIVETEDIDFLKTRINNAIKSISKLRPLLYSEKAVFAFLKNYDPFSSRKEQHANLITLKNELTEYLVVPTEKTAFELFDILSWIDSKLKNEPLQDIIEQKVKQSLLST